MRPIGTLSGRSDDERRRSGRHRVYDHPVIRHDRSSRPQPAAVGGAFAVTGRERLLGYRRTSHDGVPAWRPKRTLRRGIPSAAAARSPDTDATSELPGWCQASPGTRLSSISRDRRRSVCRRRSVVSDSGPLSGPLLVRTFSSRVECRPCGPAGSVRPGLRSLRAALRAVLAPRSGRGPSGQGSEWTPGRSVTEPACEWAVPFSPRRVSVGRRVGQGQADCVRRLRRALTATPPDRRRRSCEKDAADWSPTRTRSPPDSPDAEATMSTRTSSYQDPRYLQLWLVFGWPGPAERVPVECAGCGWTGRRARRSVSTRPCPRCGGGVAGRPHGRGGRAGTVVQLAGWSREASGRAGEPGPQDAAQLSRPGAGACDCLGSGCLTVAGDGRAGHVEQLGQRHVEHRCEA